MTPFVTRFSQIQNTIGQITAIQGGSKFVDEILQTQSDAEGTNPALLNRASIIDRFGSGSQRFARRKVANQGRFKMAGKTERVNTGGQSFSVRFRSATKASRHGPTRSSIRRKTFAKIRRKR